MSCTPEPDFFTGNLQVEWEEAQRLAQLHMQRETDRAADEADLRDDLDTEEDEPVEVSEPVSKPNGEAKQSEPSAGDDMEQEEKNEGGLYIVMIRCGLPGLLALCQLKEALQGRH
jgi:hypothetical protein